MESTAVSSGTTSNGSVRPEKSRRQNSDYLQIDPSSTFINNTARNGYEELPENFLDTISPHPTTPLATSQHSTDSPQLASLTTMSMSSESSQSFSGSYPVSLGNSYADIRHLEKSSFGNSPAGLLSPLHLDARRPSASHDFSRHTTTGIFIKQEDDTDMDGHILMQPMSSSQQQEMERIAQAETPPAVSNVELASTMIATLIGGEPGDGSPSPHEFSSHQNMLQHMKEEEEEEKRAMGVSTSDQQDYFKQATFAKPTVHRKVYSTHDSNDPLNAEIDDDIYIDTRELCKRIAYELKQHSIPQAIFAERILCRSQGTLSDLLRNPKPWNKLKSGRETFRRMFNWVRQPLATRLGILDMFKSENGEDIARVPGLSPPTPAQNVRQSRRTISDGDGPNNKRPRLVFTDIQKRTLQAIFKETQRPSREMQQTIAEHLRLDLSTVANFFMNARRRSRLGPNNDEPQPYQHVRPITPPPDMGLMNGNGMGSSDDTGSLSTSHLDGDMYKMDDPLAGCLTIDGVNYESSDLANALTPINSDSPQQSSDEVAVVKEELEDEIPAQQPLQQQQPETLKS